MAAHYKEAELSKKWLIPVLEWKMYKTNLAHD
jgi:hypothetical protein